MNLNMTSLRATDLVIYIAYACSVFRTPDVPSERELTLALSIAIIATLQVDTISDVLQQRCGSFCSTDDVMLYKVRWR